MKADLSSAADREQLVKDANAVYGPVDILVNNGAVTFYYPIETFPEKRFKLMMEVQVLGRGGIRRRWCCRTCARKRAAQSSPSRQARLFIRAEALRRRTRGWHRLRHVQSGA